MNSESTQFVPSTRMGMYEQMGMWGDFRGLDTIVELNVILDNQSGNTSQRTLGASNRSDQEASKPDDRVTRRLAQNREAARKSRLRKKAYVQQLENSKLRLIQLEQELERVRQQGMCVGGVADKTQICNYSTNSDMTVFEMEYGKWVEEQNRQISELNKVLKLDDVGEELNILIDGCVQHYFYLFAIKANAARKDVFYIMSGMWKTPTERFFFWIGGFRPSELLKIVLPHLNCLTEQQSVDVMNLTQSCQQAEDALTQGMEKLQYILGMDISQGLLVESNYLPQMGAAIEKLEALVRFVIQADHLRKETLQQICRILAPRQAARCLLALGEYLQRLRALSSCWSSRA